MGCLPGFVAIVNAFDVVYDLEERRSWLRVRLIAIGLALGTVVVASVLLAAVVIGPLFGTGHDIAASIGLGQAFATFWDWARLPVALVAAVAWATTLFHIAPSRRTPWRWDLAGAVFTAVAWVGASVAFRVYLGVAGAANQVMGTLGGALIALMWLYLLAVGLLAGAELNALLAELQRGDGNEPARPGQMYGP